MFILEISPLSDSPAIVFPRSTSLIQSKPDEGKAKNLSSGLAADTFDVLPEITSFRNLFHSSRCNNPYCMVYHFPPGDNIIIPPPGNQIVPPNRTLSWIEIGPKNPWDEQFPLPPKPPDGEVIKDLDDISKLIEHTIMFNDIMGGLPEGALDRVHEKILSKLKKASAGQNPETIRRMEAELKEAIDAAKNGDFSKLEKFKEKIDAISKDYKDKPKYECMLMDEVTPLTSNDQNTLVMAC